jgi:hypothetical protein
MKPFRRYNGRAGSAGRTRTLPPASSGWPPDLSCETKPIWTERRGRGAKAQSRRTGGWPHAEQSQFQGTGSRDQGAGVRDAERAGHGGGFCETKPILPQVLVRQAVILDRAGGESPDGQGRWRAHAEAHGWSNRSRRTKPISQGQAAGSREQRGQAGRGIAEQSQFGVKRDKGTQAQSRPGAR